MAAELRHAEDAAALRRAARTLDQLSSDDRPSPEDALATLAEIERTLHVVAGFIHDSQRELIDELLHRRGPRAVAA